MATRFNNRGYGPRQSNYLKPESLAKRAEELLAVGKAEDAFLEIEQVFQSQKFKALPVTATEPIVIRFIALAIDLRKGQSIKDNLTVYKNMVQNTSVPSIETVIESYLSVSAKKLEDAKASISTTEEEGEDSSSKKIDGDDEDADETPESILMSAVSSDLTKDRSERAIVTPWARFLFQAFRHSLEILKNNSRLELLYHAVAVRAFKFCHANGLKNDLRRLCDDVAKHLSDVGKASHNQVDLYDADTIQRHLDVRFLQLDVAVQLGLWQQAFRSIEEIHNLITLVKKSPRQSMMSAYYGKLAQIFLVGDVPLFHAAALNKYFSFLSKAADDTSSANELLYAVLSVPLVKTPEEARMRTSRLTALLGLSKTPSRESLVAEAIARGALRSSSSEAQQLYETLEKDFCPLTICAKLAPILQQISDEPKTFKYVQPLKDVIVTRMLQQLSEVYVTVDVTNIVEMVHPLWSVRSSDETDGDNQDNSVFESGDVESFVMRACRNGILSARIDHIQKSLLFRTPTTSANELSTSSGSSASTTAQSHLQSLALGLQSCDKVIAVPDTTEASAKWASALEEADTRRRQLLARRAIIKARRDKLRELAYQREQQETDNRRAAALAAEAAEREQAEANARIRERERIMQEIKAAEKRDTEDLARKIQESKSGLKIDKDDLVGMSRDDLMQKQVEQLEKENKSMAERARVFLRRTDHTERAYRRSEKSALAEDYQRQLVSDKAAHESAQKAIQETSRLEHEANMETKKRLQKILPDYRAYRSELEGSRSKEFAARRTASEKKIEQLKSERRKKVLADRAAAAEQAEKDRIAAEKAEKERAEAEETERAEREAAEAEAAKKQAELEEKRAADVERRKQERAELDRIAEKQRAREREIEERRAQAKSSSGSFSGSFRAPQPSAAAASPVMGSGSDATKRPVIGNAQSGGWREREAQRKAMGPQAGPQGQSQSASPQPRTDANNAAPAKYVPKAWVKKD